MVVLPGSMRVGPGMHAPGRSLVLAANVYISEGRCDAVIRNLEAVARSCPGVVLAHLFVDRPYNRTGLTLTSLTPDQLCDAAVSVAASSLQQVDLNRHEASHPRLGVADHVSVQPLTWSSQATEQVSGSISPPDALSTAAACARSIAKRLSLHCPVYLYGAAHPTARSLAEIRRRLGYFGADVKGSGGNLWRGALGVTSLSHYPPDEGQPEVRSSTGVATVGAVPFIINYNVPLGTSDMTQARALAKAVSARGGGLPCVEAMALHHDGCIEVACNLLDSQVTPPAAVQKFLEHEAQSRGLAVRRGYTTGKTAEELTQLTVQALMIQSAGV